MKQSSDHMQSSGSSGTKVTSLSVKGNTADSVAPSGTLPSGSSQGHSRGKQGGGK